MNTIAGAAAGLLEQVAHAGRANADEHLDELRAARFEAHPGFAGGRLRDERLARAGRPDEEHAFRNPPAQLRESLRRLEELDDLAQLGDGLVGAAHVLEVTPTSSGFTSVALLLPTPKMPPLLLCAPQGCDRRVTRAPS